MRNVFTIAEMKGLFDILQGGKLEYVSSQKVIGPEFIKVISRTGYVSKVRIVPMIENGFLDNYGNLVPEDLMTVAVGKLLIEVHALKKVLKDLGDDHVNFIRFDICGTGKYLVKASENGKYIAPRPCECKEILSLEETAALVASSVSVEYLQKYGAISISPTGEIAIDTLPMLEALDII